MLMCSSPAKRTAAAREGGAGVKRAKRLAELLVLFAFFALALLKLNAQPIFWDEGWTLTVARTWVERGHYGMLRDGEPAPPGLSASFPVVAPVALSFRFLGVGLWQGRLPGLIFTVAAFALLYYLAAQIYNRTIAKGTLAVLLVMAPHAQLNPIVVGQLVLGEMPMLFFLLAGYVALLNALRRPIWWLAVPLCWAMALATKAQPLPFWSLSIIVALGSLLVGGRRRSALWLAVSAALAILGYRWIVEIPLLALRDHTLPSPPLNGLLEVTALVPDATARAVALAVALPFAFLPILGIAYALYHYFAAPRVAIETNAAAVRLSFLALVASWYAWYVVLSIGFARYLFPAVFLGSVFAAKWLYDATGGFDLAVTVRRASALILRLRADRQNLGAWLAILAIATAAPLGLLTVYNIEIKGTDASALEVADFLNTQTPDGARIESYDSEIFFALNRRYHYPPDQIDVAVIRRSMLQPDLPIEYDPLVSDPDYLVRGPLPGGWYIYSSAIAAGHFRKLRDFGDYEIYERVR